jgi:hypothetical protein
MLVGQEQQSNTSLLLPGLMGSLSFALRAPWTDEAALHTLQRNKREAIICPSIKRTPFLLMSWVTDTTAEIYI